MEHFLDFAGWWTTERTSVLINASIALIALVSLLVAQRSLRLNRQININANRPMMMAQILMPDYAKETLRLMVSNRGKSVAKNVKVTFEPDLPSTTEQNGAAAGGFHYSPVRRVKSIFSNTVFSTWVPGHQVDVAYWLQPDEKLLDGNLISNSAEGVPANPPYVGEVIKNRIPSTTETQARIILMREPLPGRWVENCPGVVNVRPFN